MSDQETRKEEYKLPCKIHCLDHKYHCAKCNTAMSYSPANYSSRMQDIPNMCLFCKLNPPTPPQKESEEWEEKWENSLMWQRHPDVIKGFIKKVLHLQRQSILKMITDEISIAHTQDSGGKTSRLSSLYMRIINNQELVKIK